ncbi:MAG: HAMP domain-containing protein, partial [Chloroflexota bacterium]|nr:HAMP domain-containing protein [Chloroflexota bacterium]
GLMTLLLAGLGLFLFSQTESFLIKGETARLRDLVEPALSKPGPPGRAENNLTRVADKLSQDLWGTDIRGLVLDADGKPISPPGRPGTALTGSIQPGVPYETVLSTGQQAAVSLPDEEGREHTLVVLVPVRPGSDTIGLVQVSKPLREVDVLLGRLRALLLASIGVALATALLVGLLLVRLMLRPLDRMVVTAGRTGQGEFGLRTNIPHHSGDVGQLAAAFDHMLDRIESAFRARQESEARTKQFAADAFHELRSPLTALGGVAAERVLLTMRNEIERMSRLVSDLLALARLDTGTTLQLADVDLSVIATETGEQARLLADGREVRVQADASLIVRGDPDRLRQVVTNLLDNALRYTPIRGRIEL